MAWWVFVIFISFLSSSNAINRPVYKIILTQSGYTQFLQYNQLPPLKEFTFCIWIRSYDLSSDQSIFTYIANGNRLLRLWLSSGGKFLNFSFHDKSASSVPVDMVKDVWRHVCLTYQSDYGAWGIYFDSKLIWCETRRTLFHVVLPGGGSIILGYGTTNHDNFNGFEGEIFGANLLLKSTIEGNNNIAQNFILQQTHKNNIIEIDENINYVILSQLETNKTRNSFEKYPLLQLPNKNQSFNITSTPHGIVEHDTGTEIDFNIQNLLDESNDQEIIGFPEINKLPPTSEVNKIKFWNVYNKADQKGQFTSTKGRLKTDELRLEGDQLPVVLEYEKPPPPNLKLDQYAEYHNTNHNFNENNNKKNIKPYLSEVVIPPCLQQDNKVYGQWTSSKFAGSVLNYLKSINYRKLVRKPPATIPLTKINDNFPYSSDFKIIKLRPPRTFQKRGPLGFKKKRLYKRGISNPRFNVEILEDDLRSNILKMHAKTNPKYVVVTNRGNSNKTEIARSTFNELYQNVEMISKPKPFSISRKIKNRNKASFVSNTFRNKKNYALPFIKSLRYSDAESKIISSEYIPPSSDIYSKFLENGNKWHNVKSYNNDYTPRRINMDPDTQDSSSEDKIAGKYLVHPYVRLKYIPKYNKSEKDNDNINVNQTHQLAITESNNVDLNPDTISILKYNQTSLPPRATTQSFINTKYVRSPNNNLKNVKINNDSEQHVKLGNALNEHLRVDTNEEQNISNFIGRSEDVPHSNKHRFGINNYSFSHPSTTELKVCKNPEHTGKPLYIQRDGSITSSHVKSPIRKRNVAMEFVQQNYIKCSLDESDFAKSYLIYIDWSNTPLRLFGGAYPKTTTDLCGFF